MPAGNAHKYSATYQERKQLWRNDTELQDKLALVRKARGDKKRRLNAWVSAWSRSRSVANFPSFEVWETLSDLDRTRAELGLPPQGCR